MVATAWACGPRDSPLARRKSPQTKFSKPDLERNYTILHFELINLESQQLSREDQTHCPYPSKPAFLGRLTLQQVLQRAGQQQRARLPAPGSRGQGPRPSVP